MLEVQPGLTIVEAAVDDLLLDHGRIAGVVTAEGQKFFAAAVVLTAGTFLGGRILIGATEKAGGRVGDPPSNRLAARLRALDLRVARLKTGTPPRLAAATLDYGVMAEQPGDAPTPVFSFLGERREHPRQVSCHITHTTEETHDIIRASLGESPMYSGAIEGVGPRYCPSIEDKVVRFADRASHQVFVEPEGLDSPLVYPNGISTSLPRATQERFVRSIRGFEKAEITEPGYAIEYDYFDPRDLRPTLETRAVPGLFFAGQINGTTGYEEAAAQGLLAGLNAARQALGQEGWYPARNEAYLGVLVDDLLTRGVSEPYRMFTSRAEYRLLLREDNADLRLTPAGRELGLVDDRRWRVFEEKREAIARERERLTSVLVRAEALDANDRELLGSLQRDCRAADLLCRPELDYAGVTALSAVGAGSWQDGMPDEQAEQVVLQLEVEARYAGYIERQQREIDRQGRQEALALPGDIDYGKVTGLSTEARQRLEASRPATLGQASRLEGMTPAAVSLLLIHLKKRTLPAAAGR